MPAARIGPKLVMMAFKSYILYPLIVASIFPLGIFVVVGLRYIAGAAITAESLREGIFFSLGAYALMFIVFLFWQVYAVRRIKKKTGLSLKEIGKLPLKEQRRIFKEYGGG